jgi:hypothetical protein
LTKQQTALCLLDDNPNNIYIIIIITFIDKELLMTKEKEKKLYLSQVPSSSLNLHIGLRTWKKLCMERHMLK